MSDDLDWADAMGLADQTCRAQHSGVSTLRCTQLKGHEGPHFMFPYSWGFEAWGEPVVIDGEYAEIGTSTSGKSHSTEAG